VVRHNGPPAPRSPPEAPAVPEMGLNMADAASWLAGTVATNRLTAGGAVLLRVRCCSTVDPRGVGARCAAGRGVGLGNRWAGQRRLPGVRDGTGPAPLSSAW